MNQFDQFQNALLLESVSKNTYSINPDSRYFVGKTPHGGDTDYKDGLLTGLAVALSTIDQLMESEDERMSREFGEDEKK